MPKLAQFCLTVTARFLCSFCKRQRKGKLGHRFAAGQGNAAAVGIKEFVPQDGFHDVFHGHGFADAFQGSAGTGVGTLAAQRAVFPVEKMNAAVDFVTFPGACADARPATNTIAVVIGQFLCKALGFRIMAPPASQGTSPSKTHRFECLSHRPGNNAEC